MRSYSLRPQFSDELSPRTIHESEVWLMFRNNGGTKYNEKVREGKNPAMETRRGNLNWILCCNLKWLAELSVELRACSIGTLTSFLHAKSVATDDSDPILFSFYYWTVRTWVLGASCHCDWIYNSKWVLSWDKCTRSVYLPNSNGMKLVEIKMLFIRGCL